jgi:hypothetical protein
VVLAYAVLGLSYLFLPRTTNTANHELLARLIVVIFAGLGFVTGFGQLLRKGGRAEGIALATTTIAAFVLLILAL